MVSDHGVHDGEEFPGARDEGDFLGFSRSAQALVEDAELRIPAAPAERGEVKRGADAAPPTPDHPFPPQRATIPSQGRHAGQGRDLLVAERAELRQLPQQDCADDRPDARDALQEIALGLPHRAGLDEGRELRARPGTWGGWAPTMGGPTAAQAATAGRSNPPVASQTMSVGASARSRATRSATPASSFAACQHSPLGRSATSRVALATSRPTYTNSLLIRAPGQCRLVATRPCEMRARGPGQLFGLETSDGDGRRPG